MQMRKLNFQRPLPFSKLLQCRNSAKKGTLLHRNSLIVLGGALDLRFRTSLRAYGDAALALVRDDLVFPRSCAPMICPMPQSI